MTDPAVNDVSIVCPCCGARLTVDVRLARVVSHEPPPKTSGSVPDLDRASALLREQAARREALFRESTQNEKIKSQVLERKFKTALEKSKDQPVGKPTRDIDLD